MKFCQILNHPPAQLADFYGARPQLRELPFRELTAELAQDAPDATVLWTPSLADAGHDARLIIANDDVSQAVWATEKLASHAGTHGIVDAQQLVIEQLRKIKADVLCVGDPVAFDGRFISRLKRRPRIIVGWITQPAPAGTDWRGYDLMLTPHEECVRQAWRLGARDARCFPAGFPRSMAEHVCQEPITLDAVYCGRWRSGDHPANALVTALVDAALGEDRPFVLGLYLDVPEGATLPPAVRKLHQGPLSGQARYRALSSARVFVTEPQESAPGISPPLPVLEGTGVGVCTLTTQNARLSSFFEIGREIVTHDGPADLGVQICRLLADDTLRRRIARAGQERCLTDHNMAARMTALVSLLERRPGSVASTLRRAWHRLRA